MGIASLGPSTPTFLMWQVAFGGLLLGLGGVLSLHTTYEHRGVATIVQHAWTRRFADEAHARWARLRSAHESAPLRHTRMFGVYVGTMIDALHFPLSCVRCSVRYKLSKCFFHVYVLCMECQTTIGHRVRLFAHPATQ